MIKSKKLLINLSEPNAEVTKDSFKDLLNFIPYAQLAEKYGKKDSEILKMIQSEQWEYKEIDVNNKSEFQKHIAKLNVEGRCAVYVDPFTNNFKLNITKSYPMSNYKELQVLFNGGSNKITEKRATEIKKLFSTTKTINNQDLKEFYCYNFYVSKEEDINIIEENFKGTNSSYIFQNPFKEDIKIILSMINEVEA